MALRKRLRSCCSGVIDCALHFLRSKNYYLGGFRAGFRATYEACGMAA